MILVVGETLVDLVVNGDGSIEAALGGAPSNTAVAAARLGAPVAFVGAISTDRFGDQLVDRLDVDQVGTSGVVRVGAPSSLAMAELDASGAATYRFYFAETSVPQLTHVDVSGADALLTGGLALVLEPMASAVEEAVLACQAPVFVDVNCRPAIITDLDAYRTRIERVAGAASIVKVSDDDLAVLSPEASIESAATRLLEVGAGAVVVTRGSSMTTIVADGGSCDVPVDPLPDGSVVADTIGAGDTFGAGLITSLHERGLLGSTCPAPDALRDLDVLAEAVQLGHAAAAITVTRRGANPPRRDELHL